jgi:hypothetical protein
MKELLPSHDIKLLLLDDGALMIACNCCPVVRIVIGGAVAAWGRDLLTFGECPALLDQREPEPVSGRRILDL